MKAPTSSIFIDPVAFELARRPQGVSHAEIHVVIKDANPWIKTQTVSTRLSILVRITNRLVSRYIANRGSHDSLKRYFLTEEQADACADVVKTRGESKVSAYTNPKTYGIKTLDDIKARCWIDPDTGCWIWKQSFSTNKGKRGRPQCSVADKDGGKRRTLSAASLAWVLAGKEVPKGQIVYRSVCKDTACVNPAHGGCRTQAAHIKALVRSGVMNSTSIARKQAARAMGLKCATPVEKVREVEGLLEQGLTKTEIARQVGLTKCTILKIARKRHPHSSNAMRVAPGASVFTWAAA
jgi:hypothetical protein